MSHNNNELDVAIIGMAGRFPGAKNIDMFWENLANGKESITFMSDKELLQEGVDAALLKNPNYVRAASILDNEDVFDAEFFGYSGLEAARLDPQSRLFLECAWEALECAGYAPLEHAGPIGVFASQSMNTYLLRNLYSQLSLDEFILSYQNIQHVVTNLGDFLATRVSYKLNLKGPSIDVQCACSSSLVAVHLACQSLINGECEMALAGGVSLYLPQRRGYLYEEGMILSPDGHCRAFDADAKGTVFGRGVGIVVLKLFEDAVLHGDTVYAVIKGSAINNDGASKVGFTAPSVEGQARVIAEALTVSGVGAETISYVEAHGTGTAQGDPIEVAALTQVFRNYTDRNGFCALGTVKSNFGHLDAAAGIAGLIKTALMLQNKKVPPSLHYRKPNPQIDFEHSPFYVCHDLQEWETTGDPRRAGVSAFGMGGTNAHVIVEEAPEPIFTPTKINRAAHVLTLSAKSEKALKSLAERYLALFERDPSATTADICFTSNNGRSHFDHRLALVADTNETLRTRLVAFNRDDTPASLCTTGQKTKGLRRPAFLFTGQGSQYAGMGRELFDTQPTFRKTLERCDELLRPYLERPLLEVLYPEAGQSSPLDQTAYTQPALFAIEYALAELWRSWGITPSVVMGHSVGEYVAACVAGVFSLEDGLKLIAARARLMQALPSGGKMAAVFADEAQVLRAIAPYEKSVSLACLNGPDNMVISGAGPDVAAVLERFQTDGIGFTPLTVSHAFHSPLMEPMLDEFERIAAEVAYAFPRITLVSNVSGTPAREEIATAAYWRRHIRHPVRFSASMAWLRDQAYGTFMELGPQPVLLGMGARCLPDADSVWLPSLKRGEGDWQRMLTSLAELYVRGADVDWAGFDRDYPRRKVTLPTYPFERKRYWIEAPSIRAQNKKSVMRDDSDRGEHPLLGQRLYSPLFIDTVYEIVLGEADLPYLGDHRVCGMTVFPATAYVEILAAAAHKLFTDENWKLVELIIGDPLIFKEEEYRRLQLIMHAENDGTHSFRLMSAIHEETGESSVWKLHASGVLGREDVEPGQALNADLDPDRLFFDDKEELPVAAYYEALSEMGLSYGLAFTGIKRLWRGQDEVVALIQAPTDLKIGASPYHVHPALLDACLQAVLAGLPDISAIQRQDGLVLPMVLSGVRILATSSDQLWCRSRLIAGHDQNKNEMIRFSVSISDFTGRPVARIDDLQLKQVSTRTIRRHAQLMRDDWLYKIEWCPMARKEPDGLAFDASYLKSPEEIGIQMKELIATAGEQLGLAPYDRLQPELDSLCAAYVVKSLIAMGLRFDPGQQFRPDEFATQSGIPKKHGRMLRRMWQILKEDDLVVEENGTWTVVRSPSLCDTENWFTLLIQRYPSCRFELMMTKRCGENLAGVLTGKMDPIALLFPDGSLNDLENLYQHAPFTSACNALVRKAVVSAMKGVPAGRTVRILEVGAGTGGTASFVLPSLDSSVSEYVFTDVSPHFMNRAKEKFKNYDLVTYRLLDIERDPEAQGFKPGYFDIILATNVLHATRSLGQTLFNVRHLLKPGGLLVMVEGIARQRWVDLVFGLTEGWWLFSDESLRPDYPLIDIARWNSVLKDANFGDIASIPESDAQNQTLFNQAVFVARAFPVNAPMTARPNGSDTSVPRRWLVLANDSPIARELQQRFRSHGGSCDLVLLDTRYGAEKDGLYRLDPARPERFGRLLHEIKARESGEYHGAVFLYGPQGALESPVAEEIETEIDQIGSSLLNFIQALLREPSSAIPRLWVVTSGSQPVGDTSECAAVAQATLWGMIRVVALEHPELRPKCVDLDPRLANESVNSLFEEILVDDAEDQIGFRGNRRFAARLVRVKTGSDDLKDGPSGAEARPYRLDVTERGTIDNLQFVPAVRRKPEPGEVEIRVRASGLNLKDVLNSLGLYPGEASPLGLECAGEVVRLGEKVTQLQIGDEVIALAPGAFSSFVTVSEQMAVRKPTLLSFEEAASLPAAFTTAYYALCQLACISSKDTVLIHAAAGGVGMAALLLAKRCGATVFATAGNPEKRKFVESLGADYVMDSRTLQFVDEIKDITSGKGVDIVLNSLAGDFIIGSLSVLKERGRFCELGKQGILEPPAFHESRPDASYFVIDLGEFVKGDPSTGRQMLARVVQWVQDGSLNPLPVTQFPIADAKDAFRYMAQAKHVGKIVLTGYEQLNRSLIDARLDPTVPRGTDSLRFDPSASYLLTGGRGGLGLLLARWMAERGARYLILVGRSKPTHEAQEVIRDLQDAGATVYVPELDVSSPVSMATLFKEFGSSIPPLRGIIHAAGILDDGVFLQLTWNRFKTVLGPKAYGAWNLHRLSQGMNLDFFVMFSSLASVLGSAGQANHAAANAFMDCLAHFRRSRGLPAAAINWGAWSRVGAAARAEVLKRLAAQGIDAIEPEQGLELFEKLMIDAMAQSTDGCVQTSVLHVNWSKYASQFVGRQRPLFLEFVVNDTQNGDRIILETLDGPDIVDRLESAGPEKRSELLRAYIADLISRGLGLESDQPIDPRRSFSEYGLDSLMAVDLRTRISSGLSLKEPLSVTMFFDYPTLESLSDFVAKEVFGGSGQDHPKGRIDIKRPQHLTEIEELTEEEAEALLLKELAHDTAEQTKGERA